MVYHAGMHSLFPTRQRINRQLVYSANKILGGGGGGGGGSDKVYSGGNLVTTGVVKKRINTSIKSKYFSSLSALRNF